MSLSHVIYPDGPAAMTYGLSVRIFTLIPAGGRKRQSAPVQRVRSRSTIDADF